MSGQVSSVSEQMERIRRTVLERHGVQDESDAYTMGASSAIDDATRLSIVRTHWGIASEVPIAGQFIVLVQRTIRIALRWYVNPIVDQQNAFNEAVVRTLLELQAENDRLRASISHADQRTRIE